MKLRTGLFSALVMLAACGSPSGSNPGTQAGGRPTTTPRLPAGTIFVQEATAQGLDVRALSPSDGRELAKLPHGMVAPDGRRLFAITGAGSSRALQVWDHTGGKAVLSIRVPADVNLADESLDGGGPGPFSPNGRWLVLPHEHPASGASTHSRFLVVDTTGLSGPRDVDLPPGFEYDAIDDQGSNLYLLERKVDGPDYRVRAFDLAAARLKPNAVVEKGPAPEAMSGYRAASVSSADGSWLYSLYQRPAGSPFVHALALHDQVAVCIDLPVPPGSGEASLYWSVAIRGSSLYAVNSALGQAVAVDLDQLKVSRHSTFAAPAPSALQQLWRQLSPLADARAKSGVMGNAQVTPDGNHLLVSGPHGVVDLSPSSLSFRRVMLRGDSVSGVRLQGPTTLLAVVPERQAVEVVDIGTGQVGKTLRLTDPPVGIFSVSS